MTADYDEADVEAAAIALYESINYNPPMKWAKLPEANREVVRRDMRAALAAVGPSIAARARADERERIAVAIEEHAKDGSNYGAAWMNNRGYYSGLLGAAELARDTEEPQR